MMMALAGAAARYLTPLAVKTGQQFVAGKMGENIGNYNEQQSSEDRVKAGFLNEDPNAQGNRQADSTNAAASSQQGRSREDTIFNNQLKQSNNRADLQNQMAANDQEIAYRRGAQLADNYVNSAANQAQASGNILNSIMNAPTARYGSNFGR